MSECHYGVHKVLWNHTCECLAECIHTCKILICLFTWMIQAGSTYATAWCINIPKPHSSEGP